MRFLVTLLEPRARDGATKDVQQLLAVTKSFSQFTRERILSKNSGGLDEDDLLRVFPFYRR